MPATTGQFSELLAPGIRDIFFLKYKERETQYTQFLNMQTSKRKFEENLEMAALGTMPAKPEGTPTVFQDPIQGSKVRYTHISYGLGFRVTREMHDDDLYGPMRRMPASLGRSARNVREVVGASVLNNAFTVTSGFKGETLCNTAHSLLRGGTQANRPATDADISMATLEAAITSFTNLVDEEGFPMIIIPRLLIVNPTFQFTAEMLVGSNLQPNLSSGVAGAATSAINPINRRGISVMVSNYLTDADAWFLLGDEHSLNMFVRTDTEFQSGDDFDSGDAKFKSFQRFSVGNDDYRGVYGSSGST